MVGEVVDSLVVRKPESRARGLRVSELETNSAHDAPAISTYENRAMKTQAAACSMHTFNQQRMKQKYLLTLRSNPKQR